MTSKRPQRPGGSAGDPRDPRFPNYPTRPPSLADDRALIEDVADAIERLQAIVPYADVFAPIPDELLEEALRRHTVMVKGAPLGEDVVEVVTPPVFGRYLLAYSTSVAEPCRRFAKRHGLGHVVGGHVTEISYLARGADYAHYEERFADLFALADLAPWWQIVELRKAGSSWGALRQMLCRVIRHHTVDWPEDRVLDRARLRLELYRFHLT